MSRLDWRELLAIFGGGCLGAGARAVVENALPFAVNSWPWATFAVNIVGAFLLGVFATLLQERLPPSAYRRPFLGTGVCGALTTFSALQLELLRMIDVHAVGLALGYAAASIMGGLAAMWLATGLVRRAWFAA